MEKKLINNISSITQLFYCSEFSSEIFWSFEIKTKMEQLLQFLLNFHKDFANEYWFEISSFIPISGVDYVSDFDAPMSSKGKCPWITLNKVDVSDSQIAMEYIADKLNKDLSKHLSPEERAIARYLNKIF